MLGYCGGIANHADMKKPPQMFIRAVDFVADNDVIENTRTQKDTAP